MDSESRVDLFISFHGSEALRPDFSTRQLARLAKEKLVTMCRRNGVDPSIFFDEDGLRSELSTIFEAILQTRGGGVALFLLTRHYFHRHWCLAELRAFLHLHRSSAIKLRFVCLEDSPSLILKDSVVTRLVPEFGSEFSLLNDIKVSSLESTAAAIANLVWKAWASDDGFSAQHRPTILGRTCERSFLHLQKQFTPDDMPAMRAVLGMASSAPSNVFDMFSAARERGHVGYYDVSALYKVVTQNNSALATKQHAAIEAYEQKWVHSNTWEWSAAVRDKLQLIFNDSTADVQALEETRPPTSAPRSTANSASAETAANLQGGKLYVVKSGDFLWKVADRELGNGDRWPEIFELNRGSISDPNVLFPGQRLRLPRS